MVLMFLTFIDRYLQTSNRIYQAWQSLTHHIECMNKIPNVLEHIYNADRQKYLVLCYSLFKNGWIDIVSPNKLKYSLLTWWFTQNLSLKYIVISFSVIFKYHIFSNYYLCYVYLLYYITAFLWI